MLKELILIFLVGILDPVTNIQYTILNNEAVNISWDVPYSLDIPRTDPYITYCVYIRNRTSLFFLYSRCRINVTYHICDTYSPLLACAEFLVQVLAVNPAGKSDAAEVTAWSKCM